MVEDNSFVPTRTADEYKVEKNHPVKEEKAVGTYGKQKYQLLRKKILDEYVISDAASIAAGSTI